MMIADQEHNLETQLPQSSQPDSTAEITVQTVGAAQELTVDVRIVNESSIDDLADRIVDILKTIFDPEIPVNIYDLGLIYSVIINAEAEVLVEMTLTAPGCPVAATFPGTVEGFVAAVDGVKLARVELVWDPPWTQERMTEAARLQLGLL
jgi:FeS assembly SUF system protein